MALKHRTLWLGVIVVVTIGTRLAIYLAFPNVFAFERTGVIQGFDAYDTLAQNLLRTGIYGIKPGIPDAGLPPLYGYVLSVVYQMFGRGSLQVALLNALFDAITVVLLAEIGRQLMPAGRPVGLLAGLLVAIYPYLVFQSLTVIDTPIFMTLFHGFILAMILLVRRTSFDRACWGLIVLGGLVLGLAALDRPVVVAAALGVALWFSLRLGLLGAIRRLLPVAVLSVLVILPWNIRNYQVFHAFVDIGTHAGMNFWFGNSQYTIPFFRAGYHTQWAQPDLPSTPLDPHEADGWLFNLALQFLREHPEQIPELTWVKFLAYWSIDVFPRKNPVSGDNPIANYQGVVRTTVNDQGELEVTGVPQNDALVTYSQPLFDRIGRLVHIFYFGGLLALAVAGVVLTRRAWREVSLLWLLQISMTLVYVVFSGPTTRYRLPTDPTLFLFSAYALITAWGLVSRRLRSAHGLRDELAQARG